MNAINYAILPFFRYFDFRGRSSRSEYWWYSLLLVIIGILYFAYSIAAMPSFTDMMDPDFDETALGYGFIDYVYIIFSLATFIPNLAVSVRRLHDINRTGWWLAAFYGLMATSSVLSTGAMITIFVSAMVAISGDMSSMGSSFGGAYILIALSIGIFIGTLVWMIVWFASPSVSNNNRFGDDPI
ncbi:MAG: DUF805 domain-containing protein [Alphaproteobacteria bacterium]|nr:DUF805 domain-containing protein [Alphaproteobacteria bacterium]MBL6781710.1 DUF805 domain-containing protein [Alphaproteobacteria bacterium]